jgi:hypothetical protein
MAGNRFVGWGEALDFSRSPCRKLDGKVNALFKQGDAAATA